MTPPPSPPSRRGVLAGAASLAGAGVAMSAGVSSAVAESRGESRREPRDAVVFRDVRPMGAAKPVDLTVVDGRITRDRAPRGPR